MTRKSKRELEREVEKYKNGTDTGRREEHRPLLVSEDPATGIWYDSLDGTVYEKSETNPIAVIPEPIDQATAGGTHDAEE